MKRGRAQNGPRGWLGWLKNALEAFGRHLAAPEAGKRLAGPPRTPSVDRHGTLSRPVDKWRAELRRRLDTANPHEEHLERMLAAARDQTERVFCYRGERVTREEFIGLCEQALTHEWERRRRWNEGEEYLGLVRQP